MLTICFASIPNSYPGGAGGGKCQPLRPDTGSHTHPSRRTGSPHQRSFPGIGSAERNRVAISLRTKRPGTGYYKPIPLLPRANQPFCYSRLDTPRCCESFETSHAHTCMQSSLKTAAESISHEMIQALQAKGQTHFRNILRPSTFALSSLFTRNTTVKVAGVTVCDFMLNELVGLRCSVAVTPSSIMTL